MSVNSPQESQYRPYVALIKEKAIFYMNKKIAVALSVITMAGVTFAQETETIMKAEIYTNTVGESLKYRIYIPDNISKLNKCPLLLFLHGAGERGDDNKSQLKHCITNIVAYSKEHKEPVILIAPQCPQNMKWSDIDWGKTAHTMPESASVPMKLALKLCGKISCDYPVDQKRIYIAGLSMGGFGTWDAIQRNPDYFAAAIPVCGGGDTNLARRLVKIPIWVFHGGSDPVVKPENSRVMVEAIKKSGGNPKYTEYEGVGHDCWTRTFKDSEVLDWLLSQKK